MDRFKVSFHKLFCAQIFELSPTTKSSPVFLVFVVIDVMMNSSSSQHLHLREQRPAICVAWERQGTSDRPKKDQGNSPKANANNDNQHNTNFVVVLFDLV